MTMNTYDFQPSFNSASPQFFPKTHTPRAPVQDFIPTPELLPMHRIELPISPLKKSHTASFDAEEVHSDASTSGDSVDVKKNGKFDRSKEYKKK